LNKDNTSESSAFLIANYIHNKLRKHKLNKKHIVDMECPDEVIINVLKYIQAKDSFKTYYSKFLGQRLIYNKSEDMFKEGLFVDLIRKECGNDYTKDID
jgi:hypothetical protein